MIFSAEKSDFPNNPIFVRKIKLLFGTTNFRAESPLQNPGLANFGFSCCHTSMQMIIYVLSCHVQVDRLLERRIISAWLTMQEIVSYRMDLRLVGVDRFDRTSLHTLPYATESSMCLLRFCYSCCAHSPHLTVNGFDSLNNFHKALAAHKFVEQSNVVCCLHFLFQVCVSG